MNSFLSELSRRNVFRVAAAYVIVSWLVLQVVSVLMPALHLPGWMPSVAFTILLIGFPVAVLLTWGFEMTPQGVRKIEAGSSPSLPSSKALDLGLLVVAALLITVTMLRPAANDTVGTDAVDVASHDVAQPPEDLRTSIAVLAFANMSGDPENEYFSDGISEEILNALAGIKSMRVAARTSAFSFKGKNQDVRVIGEALDVANVLEGSVRRSGDRVRITAQLINVAGGYHLWSQTYDRELTDIFAVQEEIALAITEALKIELNIEEKEAISRQGTDNIEAYRAYLKGLQARNATNLYVTFEANGFFKEAVELDPEFSDAWGALAMDYAYRAGGHSFASVEDDLVEAFSTALKLDQGQSGGLAAKAFYTTVSAYDWARAGELYRQALQNDHDVEATRLYIQQYLYPLGRNKEAIAHYRKTMRRDPMNYGLRREAAFVNSSQTRDNAFALEQLDLLEAAGENIDMFLCTKAEILALLDRDDEALESLAEADPMENVWETLKCALANYHLGRLDHFNTLSNELRTGETDEYRRSIAKAVLYGSTGDFESWLESMNMLLANRNAVSISARSYEPGVGDHISDPRYQALLKSLRLDDASLAEMGMTWGEQGLAE